MENKSEVKVAEARACYTKELIKLWRSHPLGRKKITPGYSAFREYFKKFIPILFSLEMVKAILSERKIMTRRIVKNINEKCPYGKVGDVLWVREEHYVWGTWVACGETKTGRVKWKFVPGAADVEMHYCDNPPEIFKKSRCDYFPEIALHYKRLARFMPKKYCRLHLEITDIRIERLQDINKEDAQNEGVKKFHRPLFNDFVFKDYLNLGEEYRCPISSFRSLWEKINGLGSWDKNPWVWVISFKRI